MAVFMAGVGTAEIFKVGKDGQENLFSTAKTLTESGITIGVSAEDIRAGAGAKLYGKYFHTSTFDLKMTDAMFKLEYIAANVGSEIDIGGDVFKTETLIADEENKKIILSETPVSMICSDDVYVYIKKPADEFYKTYKMETVSKEIEVEEAGEYCVKYLYTNENAKELTVKANFIPDTLRVYLTMNLFSGDDKNPATGTKIGTVTIMIPRFLLNGTQDLSMNMTGASTTSFEGSALAAEDCGTSGCDSDGIYAKIIEIIDNFKWTDLVVGFSFDNSTEILDTNQVDDYVNVFAYFYDMKPKMLKVGVDYQLQNAEESPVDLTIQGNYVSGKVDTVARLEAIGLNDLLGFKATKDYIYKSLTYSTLDETTFDNFVLS